MKIHPAHLFLNNSIALKWLENVIDYISASYNNSGTYKLIKEFGDKRKSEWIADSREKTINESISIMAFYYPEGIASIKFFFEFTEKYNLYGDYAGGHLQAVGNAFELLHQTHILKLPYDTAHRDLGFNAPGRTRVYHINNSLSRYLISNGLIYNYLFGFNYIIDKYTNSVVTVEIKQGDELAFGTGWLFDIKTTDSLHPIIRLVVTNDHVLTGSGTTKVRTKDGKELMNYKKELCLKNTNVDLALLQVDYDEAIPAFQLNAEVLLLEEVITIGYPIVPTTRDAYQVVHRGEVNARVTTQWHNELLIISARTAPGNSGSPVIDDTGRVIGMVTEQLFDKATFEQKGITPYSACIPAGVIAQTILRSELVLSFMS